MERYVVSVIFACLSLSQSQRPTIKHYRSDYEYNQKTDAFYKFHVGMERVWRARQICKAEGAQLLVVNSLLDIAQVHGMFKRYPDLEYAWVEDDGNIHDSAEEDPVIDLTPQGNDFHEFPRYLNCDVVSRAAELHSHDCFSLRPFICKMEARNAYYDSQCQVYSRNYGYVANMSSCYKIPRIAYNWNQAYDECDAEGSHLVIINSEAENEMVWHIMKTNPPVEGAKFGWFYFAGFRANKPDNGTPREFRTVFNQTLEEAGYVHWGQYEPNNSKGVEDCGCIFKNDGTFNDVNCMYDLPFVCEKDIVPDNS